MKKGDIRYVVDIDYKHSTLYKAEMMSPHPRWQDNWNVKYLEVVFDFLNQPNYTLEGQEGTYDADTHIFDTIEECIVAITTSNYGMRERPMVKRIFK